MFWRAVLQIQSKVLHLKEMEDLPPPGCELPDTKEMPEESILITEISLHKGNVGVLGWQCTKIPSFSSVTEKEPIVIRR